MQRHSSVDRVRKTTEDTTAPVAGQLGRDPAARDPDSFSAEAFSNDPNTPMHSRTSYGSAEPMRTSSGVQTT